MIRLIDELRPLPHKGSDPADNVEFITPSKCKDLISDASRLHRLKEWRKEQLTLMCSVNSEIVQLRDQQELFKKISQLIQSTFNFYFVAFYTADGTTGRITYRSSAGKALSKEQIRELAGPGGIAFGAGLVGTCAAGGRRLL